MNELRANDTGSIVSGPSAPNMPRPPALGLWGGPPGRQLNVLSIILTQSLLFLGSIMSVSPLSQPHQFSFKV